MDEQTFSQRNALDKISISTPKFEGFKNNNIKNNITNQNVENEQNEPFKNDNSPLKERIIFSEKKNVKKILIDFKISNSSDNKKNLIFSNFRNIKKEKKNSEKQISFDEKSENYLFTNDMIDNNSNKKDINKNNSKNLGSIISNNKKENDESFNYDLPLEMDKSSEIFNLATSKIEIKHNLNNLCDSTKFQEYNYNNILINSKNKENNINKISINIKKNNNINYLNIKENNSNDRSKKYFSFDGENQISEENKTDKTVNNMDNVKKQNELNNCINQQNQQLNLENDNQNEILDSNKIINISNDINEKEINLIEKIDISNKNENKKVNIIISTPKKEIKKNFTKLLESEEKSSKRYSIQREKKLINKNLIGYLAFNSSNSIQSKNSIICDDSFSYKNNRDNSKLSELNPSKKLILDNINDSIDKLSKTNKINMINNKRIKNDFNNIKNNTIEMKDNKDISIDLQFNNYLNRSRNLNNNIKNCFTKNEKVLKFINKNKTLPSKVNNNLQNTFNSFIDLNKISKVKNRHTIKYSRKHEKNISSLNTYSNSIKNNFFRSRNGTIECSNTSESINLYNSINLNDNNISSKILFNKKSNTLKTIPIEKKLNIIKVNKMKNIQKNKSIKKSMEKFNTYFNNNIYDSLPFANSTKFLKIKNKVLYTLNLDNKDEINKQNFIHKTSKINYINYLKNKIESLKRINHERLSSYENKKNYRKNELKKNIFIKNKIPKIKISLDPNLKKKLNLIKNENNIKNPNKIKKYNSRNYNNDQNLYTKYYTNQNIYKAKYSNIATKTLKGIKQSNIQINKLNDYNKKISKIPISNKDKNINNIYSKKNKIKNIEYYRDHIIKHNIIENKLNKKSLALKQKSNYFNSVEIKPNVNIIDQDIIKLTIIRNNANNKISQAFSVTLGKNENNKYNSHINDIDKSNKKTIINVNQYYPNYYISSNNPDKTIEESNKNNNIFNSNFL